MHFGIGVHRALALDPPPLRFKRHAPWAGGCRRIAQPAAAQAGLQVEIMRRAIAEIVEVLMIEIRHLQRHPEIGGLNPWHCSVLLWLSRGA
jgi:hypothetical protein